MKKEHQKINQELWHFLRLSGVIFICTFGLIITYQTIFFQLFKIDHLPVSTENLWIIFCNWTILFSYISVYPAFIILFIQFFSNLFKPIMKLGFFFTIIILFLFFISLFLIFTADFLNYRYYSERISYNLIELISNSPLSINIHVADKFINYNYISVFFLFYLTGFILIFRKFSYWFLYSYNLLTRKRILLLFITLVLILAMGSDYRYIIIGNEYSLLDMAYNSQGFLYIKNPYFRTLASNPISILTTAFHKRYKKEKIFPKSPFFQNNIKENKKNSINRLQKEIISENEKFISNLVLDRTINPPSPLLKKYNLVFIELESWDRKLTDCLTGKHYGLTPNFDKLSEKSILLKNFYSNGNFTELGITSVMMSVPPSEIPYDIGFDSKNPVQLLKKNGYHNFMIMGSSKHFQNTESTYLSRGFNEIIGEEDFPDNWNINCWGVGDNKVFDKLLEKMNSSQQPFLGLVQTLTTHAPYPEELIQKFNINSPSLKELLKQYPQLPIKHLNSLVTLDYYLGCFFEKAQLSKNFKNTIFILFSDHCSHFMKSNYFSHENYEIAGMIYAPHILKPEIYKEVCSQIDLFPTLLHYIEFQGSYRAFGKSIFNKKHRKVYLSGGMKSVYDGKNFLVDDFYGEPLVIRERKIVKDRSIEQKLHPYLIDMCGLLDLYKIIYLY